MRRFEPAASRVRRLRSSFNILTFPGRNARTVNGFNRRPRHYLCGTTETTPLRGASRPSLSSRAITGWRDRTFDGNDRLLRVGSRRGQGVLQVEIITK